MAGSHSHHMADDVFDLNWACELNWVLPEPEIVRPRPNLLCSQLEMQSKPGGIGIVVQRQDFMRSSTEWHSAAGRWSVSVECVVHAAAVAALW